jgi:hypothetical protein
MTALSWAKKRDLWWEPLSCGCLKMKQGGHEPLTRGLANESSSGKAVSHIAKLDPALDPWWTWRGCSKGLGDAELRRCEWRNASAQGTSLAGIGPIKRRTSDEQHARVVPRHGLLISGSICGLD